MADTQQRAKDYVDAQAAQLRTATQAEIEDVLLNSILDSLQYSQSVSIWLLAITGASLPLLLSNADAALRIVSIDRFRITILLMILSGLTGAFAKARDMQVQIWRHLHRTFLTALPSIFVKHDEAEEQVAAKAAFLGLPSPEIQLTPEHMIKVLEEVVPRLYRGRIRKAAAAGPGDPLGVLKGAIRLSNAQAVALVIQVLFFLAAAATFAWP